MSTNCPPQLQLSINPNTTSFKRSFEQFGFDLESPVGASAPGGAGASAANSDGRGERNKRARSASSFDSVPSSDISSDTLASASSSGSSAPSQGSVVGAFPTATLAEPPRLPTPDIQDVVMSDYPSIDPVESTREALQSRERYRLSLQRFNEFDSEIELLRQSPPSTTTTSPSPPTLPPLRHRLMSDDVVLFRRHTPPSVSSPFSSDFFVESPSSRNESDSSQAHAHLPSSSISISETTNSPFDLVFRETQSLPPLSLPGNSSSTSTTLSSSPLSTPAAGFRDRLDTALQGLRSTSPLVPGLEDRDPELRGEEEMRNRVDQQGLQEFQVPDENRSLIDERPPTLPPIQTTDDIFHSSNITSRAEPPPSSVHHQSVAPNPPTLPPIPTVSAAAAAATAAGAGDADPADRAWHGRGQLFTEQFDDFMGLNRDFGSTMPTRRDGLTHNDGMDHSPLSSPSEGRETASSPRPFSRSAAPALSSYAASRNPGLSDHPLPSPILRDLHSWMEERRPSTLGGNGRYSNQNAAQTQTDDSSSVSSISTTAATAGTERDASALSSSSAVMGSTTGSESSYTTSPQEDHLNQIMESIRTRSRVEDWAGRSRHCHPPRVSHTSSPWPNSNAESDILRDLLPWYSGDPSPAVSAGASAAIPNTTPEASRPISTTPAPAPHMMLNPGSESSTVDSYWEPVFTNLPETDFMVTNASRTTTAPLSATEAPGERHWNPTTRQRHQDGSARSLISRFSDRQYATASSQSGTSPTSPESSTPSTYVGMSTPEAPERGINHADGASHRDRRVSDSTGGLWRLLDSPTELSLNFRFDAPSSSTSNSIPPASGDTTNNNNNNSHPYQATNTARNIDTEGNRSYYESVMRDSFAPSSQPPPPPTTTLNLDNHQASSAGGGPSLTLHGMSTLSQRLHARDMLMRGAALPMRDQIMIESPSTQMPVSSSLSNWNGRPYTTQGALSQPTEASLPQTIGPSTISGSSSSPTLLSSSEHERLNSNSTSNSNLNSNSSSVDATRRTDIRLRHRLFHSRSQTRPGSSNSLVTENASEARRRADHEELRRRIFRDQWSSPLDNDTEEHSSSGNDSSENSWEDAIIERALTQHWRSRFATARGQSNTDGVNEASRPYHLPNPVPHSSSLLDRMETSENSIPTLTSQNNHAPPPVPSYPPQAPSLPPPDLGNSFIAAPHTRSNSAQWSSERIFEDSMDTSVPAPMPSETLFGLHNVNDRRSFNSHAHSRPRPVSTTVAIDLRQMRERDQQNERGLHQMMSDDRALHDGHVHWESVQETRLRNRAAELERRITGGGPPHLHHPPSFVNRSTMFNYAPRPTPTPTTATAIASGSDIPRPAANEMRGRVPTTDSAGRYTHFDPSSFAAGPFRNTLQHIAQRDQVPRLESSLAREYARHSSSYLLPLPFVEEMDYTPTRMDSAERNRLRAQQPGRDEEAHRDISGSVDTMMRHLQPGNYSSRAIAEEVHAAVHNTDTSLNSDPNANRRPARFVAAMDRYRRARAEAALDDSLQRIREHAALVEDLHGSRTAPPLHRARRMAPRVEDDDDTSTPETTAPRTARAPRRTLRGEAFMLSRMPATSANASFGPAWRRGRPLGDFMRDEDFDSSYENLLSLSMQIGDAKPRATPAEVLSKMQKGLYQEFASEGSDTRCPICLDDYEPTDPVQKLSNCSHWLHEGCLSQWLQTASTCPVCRESVAPSSPSPISFRASRYRAMPFQLQSLHMPNRRRRADPSPPSSSPQAATPTSARHDEYTTSSPSSPTTTNNANVTRRRSQGSNGTTQSPNRANPEAAPWRYRRS